MKRFCIFGSMILFFVLLCFSSCKHNSTKDEEMTIFVDENDWPEWLWCIQLCNPNDETGIDNGTLTVENKAVSVKIPKGTKVRLNIGVKAMYKAGCYTIPSLLTDDPRLKICVNDKQLSDTSETLKVNLNPKPEDKSKDDWHETNLISYIGTTLSAWKLFTEEFEIQENNRISFINTLRAVPLKDVRITDSSDFFYVDVSNVEQYRETDSGFYRYTLISSLIYDDGSNHPIYYSNVAGLPGQNNYWFCSKSKSYTLYLRAEQDNKIEMLNVPGISTLANFYTLNIMPPENSNLFSLDQSNIKIVPYQDFMKGKVLNLIGENGIPNISITFTNDGIFQTVIDGETLSFPYAYEDHVGETYINPRLNATGVPIFRSFSLRQNDDDSWTFKYQKSENSTEYSWHSQAN